MRGDCIFLLMHFSLFNNLLNYYHLQYKEQSIAYISESNFSKNKTDPGDM